MNYGFYGNGIPMVSEAVGFLTVHRQKKRKKKPNLTETNFFFLRRTVLLQKSAHDLNARTHRLLVGLVHEAGGEGVAHGGHAPDVVLLGLEEVDRCNSAGATHLLRARCDHDLGQPLQL